MLKQELLQFIENFRPLQILVVGDLMLDHYLFGKVQRISPEAPVPILEVQQEKFLLGGAGSCVANLNALNNQAEIAAVCGRDENGDKIRSLLETQKNSTKLVLQLNNYKTTVKSRLLSQKQQLLRVDYEQEFSLQQELADELLEKLDEISKFQAVIFSDYNKGFCTPYILQKLLQKTKEQNIFTIVDPARGNDFLHYQGASCIKPNRLEAEIFCGRKLQNKADYLKFAEQTQKKCNIPIVALSLDSEGLLIYQGANNYHFFATSPQSVFDVTGAGDLVVTILGLVLASGGKAEIAANLANIAASIAIRKLGNYHPTWQEIKQEIEKTL